MTKFKAQKVKVDGIVFASKAEHRHWCNLKLLERAGKITQLVLHPVYQIELGGKKICKVIGDFRYIENGKTVVDDVKGYSGDTPVSRLKRKLVCAQYPNTEWRIISAK